ncbi:hypothetical protein BDV59DRAFT_169965, partial [Aspergillus ambiguus]|uniref:uncharacterized protein n=1 Tax=Aspergillus ambiguus TaxID=176160 RepID=UPI003CCE2569
MGLALFNPKLEPVIRWSCNWPCTTEVEIVPPSTDPPRMSINLASRFKLAWPFSDPTCCGWRRPITIGWDSARVAANRETANHCKLEANRVWSRFHFQLSPQMGKTNIVGGWTAYAATPYEADRIYGRGQMIFGDFQHTLPKTVSHTDGWPSTQGGNNMVLCYGAAKLNLEPSFFLWGAKPSLHSFPAERL